MKIVFLTNYYNHHQSEFAKNMVKATNGNFIFVACESVEEERANMGWQTSNFPDFVHQLEEEREYCINQIDNADVVIYGSAPKYLIKNRLKNNKLIFIYCERLYKKIPDILHFIKNYLMDYSFARISHNFYCLCASAFTSGDFKKLNLFKDKCYKWGYFPKINKFDKINEKVKLKRSSDVSILFVSRLIECKHPELPVEVAKKLKDEGVNFHLTMIGIGEMEDKIHSMISEYELGNNITHIKSMTPAEVRTYMDKASIFIFTSDRNEGWGAVLNESMNSGCAVVASSEIGSVPFMMKDGVNGYIYQNGNFDDLYDKVKELCLNQEKREQMGIEAYNTTLEIWNADNATSRLMLLIDDIQKRGYSDRFNDGPCSKAEIVKDDWYKL